MDSQKSEIQEYADSNNPYLQNSLKGIKENIKEVLEYLEKNKPEYKTNPRINQRIEREINKGRAYMEKINRSIANLDDYDIKKSAIYKKLSAMRNRLLPSHKAMLLPGEKLNDKLDSIVRPTDS